MFGLNFNPITSKTVIAGLIAAGSIIWHAVATTGLTPDVIGLAVAAFLGAIGLRSAIAANGVGSTPAVADKANGVS